MTDRDQIKPMLATLGLHLARIEKQLQLRKMTPKEKAHYSSVESGESSLFKKLLEEGRHHVGSGFFDDLWDGVKSVGSTALDVVKHVAPVVAPLALGLGDHMDEDDYHEGGNIVTRARKSRNKHLLDVNNQRIKPHDIVTIKGRKYIASPSGLTPYLGGSYEVGGDYHIGGYDEDETDPDEHAGGDYKIGGNYRVAGSAKPRGRKTYGGAWIDEDGLVHTAPSVHNGLLGASKIDPYKMVSK